MSICIVAKCDTADKICNFLSLKNIKIDIFSNALDALQAFRKGVEWRIAYLEENLPDISGSTLKSLLSYEFPDLPIILTNGFDKKDFCQQLDKVLMENQSNVAPKPSFKNLRMNGFVLNFKMCTAYKNGDSIKLRKKETALLAFLIAHKGQMVSKKTLLESVWSCRYSYNSRTVDAHIHQLRRKIGSDTVVIKNLPRQGFIITEAAT